jgi:hypothetical protein
MFLIDPTERKTAAVGGWKVQGKIIKWVTNLKEF